MTDIVSYSGPGFYPPLLVDVINASWTLGNERYAAFDAKIADATTGWLNTASAPTIPASTVGVPTVTEPTVTIPTSASVSEVMATWDDKYVELANYLAGKLSDFRATYFPADNANYAAAAAWLDDALANPDQVLPPALAAVIWEEDRSRILLDTARATDDVTATWAANGYALPAGAEANAILQIQQASLQELAKSSRNVAVKTFELAYERVKFVISTALSTQQAASSAALDYLKSLAVSPDIASRLTSSAYEAETRLVAAAGAFYSARSEATKVALTATQFNAAATQGAAEKNQASELAMIQARLQAMMDEARALIQGAAALFNNMHASVGVSAGDSVSTSL